MVVLTGLCLVVPPGARALPVPEPPARLVIDPALLARLRVLAAGLHNEIVLCLTGSTDGASALATGFVMPEPAFSGADRASFGPCPAGTLAIWHNHPPERWGTGPEPWPPPQRGDPHIPARELCALSATDIRAARGEIPPFIVVAVDAETWCWWTREQVRKLAARNVLHGAAVAGQVVSGPARALPSRPR